MTIEPQAVQHTRTAEAVKLTGENFSEVVEWCGGRDLVDCILIPGRPIVEVGDILIRLPDGSFEIIAEGEKNDWSPLI